jgi:uncharacterized protein YbjT (DUF2867 family)
MQNVRAQWEPVITRGVFRVPYAATTLLGMVDLVDVAEVAARVLTGDGHDGATYELCGPEVLEQGDIAAVLARRLSRPVRLEIVQREEWAQQALGAGFAAHAVDNLVAMFRHYEHHGFWGSPRVLESLLQRPAGRFEQVVERWAAGVEP